MFYSQDNFSAIDNLARAKEADFESLFRFPTDDSSLTLSEISKRTGPKLTKDPDRTYVCSHCGKEYKRRWRWRRCEAIHAGGPLRYRCTFCEKSFHEKMGLIRHMRSHTGEAPYQCTECGNRFKTEQNFKQHVVIHTGETPFECLRCNQKFKFYSTRNNHKCPV